MNSSATLDRLERFIATIKGISASNRQGLEHLLSLLKGEQAARDAAATVPGPSSEESAG